MTGLLGSLSFCEYHIMISYIFTGTHLTLYSVDNDVVCQSIRKVSQLAKT